MPPSDTRPGKNCLSTNAHCSSHASSRPNTNFFIFTKAIMDVLYQHPFGDHELIALLQHDYSWLYRHPRVAEALRDNIFLSSRPWKTWAELRKGQGWREIAKIKRPNHDSSQSQQPIPPILLAKDGHFQSSSRLTFAPAMATFNDLPPELIETIFKYLQCDVHAYSQHLILVAGVSRRWDAIAFRLYAKTYSNEPFNMSLKQVRGLWKNLQSHDGWKGERQLWMT